MGSNNGKPVLRDEDVDMLTKSSNKTEEEVRESFAAFLSAHPNGKLSPKDLKELIAEALPGKDGAKMQKHVFRIYDANNDGFIDFTEFMVIFIVMSGGTPQDVLAKLFRIYDQNSDGSITLKEMKKLVKDMYGLLRKDNPRVAAEALIATTAHAEMDKNMDGKITMDEFTAACMGQDEITKMLTLKLLDIFVEGEAD